MTDSDFAYLSSSFPNFNLQFYSGSQAKTITSSPTIIQVPEGIFTDVQYENSNYNPLLNNVNLNRYNSILYDLDYRTNSIQAANLYAVLSGSASPAQTPDSNYTSLKSILPRYSGSTLYASNYNVYVESKSAATLADGTKTLWYGDQSYGKSPLIEKRPQYYAHFNYSYPSNQENAGTFTFNLDKLIPVDPNDPNIIYLDADSTQDAFISRVLEPTRKTSIYLVDKADNSPNPKDSIFSQVSLINSPNFTFLTSGSWDIFRSCLSYFILASNEVSTIFNTNNLK
jgi:hypothetical protein